MQIITTWLLTLAFVLSGVLGGVPASAESAENAAAAAVPAMSERARISEPFEPSEPSAASDAALSSGVPYAEMTYEHYDTAAFCENADRLCALADAGDAEAVKALYDTLYDQFNYVDVLYCLAMLHHDADIYDEYWAAEYTYMDATWTELADVFGTTVSYALESAVSKDLRAHIGRDAANAYAYYEPLSDEGVDRSERELALRDEYNTLYDGMDDISCEYGGETWTRGDLYGARGDSLWRRDYDAYVDVYYALQQALCEAFAPIYVELAGLWAQDAAEAGYDSYADYAYEQVFGRSYTPEDAQVFCDAIKPIAAEYYADLYYSDLFDEASAAGGMTTEELFAAMETYLPQIDESLLDSWHFLTENGLYDIEIGASGRYTGSYTTSLSYYDSAFIFMTGDGSCLDLSTLSHEFGHFADCCRHPVPDVMLSMGDYDLSEIHSNGLEALFETFYPAIYGDDADTAQFSDLAFQLENVIDGCLYDEFQRRTLAEADTLTAERVNEIYIELCMEYGVYDRWSLPAYDAGWVYVGHLFESPMYYVSYAASGFASLQLWDIAREDFGAAVEAYLSVLDAGAYDVDYFAVLRHAGLRAFDEDGAVAEVLTPVLDRLEELDRASRRR